MSLHLQERLRDISEDGGSTTSRKRKEVPPHREPEREREKGAEKGGEKERDREHRDRDRDYDRERGGSRYRHHGHEETDTYHRSTRDHPRERERERDWDREHREKDRDRHAGYKGTAKHHREHDRDDRRRRSREVAFDEKPEDRAEKVCISSFCVCRLPTYCLSICRGRGMSETAMHHRRRRRNALPSVCPRRQSVRRHQKREKYDFFAGSYSFMRAV